MEIKKNYSIELNFSTDMKRYSIHILQHKEKKKIKKRKNE